MKGFIEILMCFKNTEKMLTRFDRLSAWISYDRQDGQKKFLMSRAQPWGDAKHWSLNSIIIILFQYLPWLVFWCCPMTWRCWRRTWRSWYQEISKPYRITEYVSLHHFMQAIILIIYLWLKKTNKAIIRVETMKNNK